MPCQILNSCMYMLRMTEEMQVTRKFTLKLLQLTSITSLHM